MINPNPLITVYITNYNYGRYIEKSIESVIAQSLQDFELLIIDDGSTDNSKEIIETYSNLDCVTIIYQKNKGLNITNNVAMRASKGRYLMRLDADDFLEPDALAVMSQILENDPELGLVFPDYYYIDKEGNRTGEERRHNFEREVSLYDQPAHGACTMIRLEFLKNLGGYNESFTCQDGYDLWIKFITHHKVTNVNRPLFSYRQHGNNLTGNENRILDTRREIKETFVRQHLNTPVAIAVIPVRNTYIGSVNWPNYIFNGKSILEHKIDVCLSATKIKYVVISSSDVEIIDFCRNKYANVKRVIPIMRPSRFEGPDQTLADTIMHAVEQIPETVEAVMTVSIDCPFLHYQVLDEVVNTQVLFKSDSVLTVRPDNFTYYKHVGHGMVPINDNNKFTKLEREALYKGAGGVMLTTLEQLKKSKKSISGNVAHVVVDVKSSFTVTNLFEFEIFNSLNPVKHVV